VNDANASQSHVLQVVLVIVRVVLHSTTAGSPHPTWLKTTTIDLINQNLANDNPGRVEMLVGAHNKKPHINPSGAPAAIRN
jgi:hypothetical protein